MNILALSLVVALLSVAFPVAAQRSTPGDPIDILTGEPVRPRTAQPRPEPEIFNAPHAPRQPQANAGSMPLEIYIAPQIGAGGTAALQQRGQFQRQLPAYPGRQAY